MIATLLEVCTQSSEIDVYDLNFYYGKSHALKNISLQIPEKQVTASIGPPGCGELTLLRTSNRMYVLYPERRAEDQINMDGENLLTLCMDIALLCAEVGIVSQRPTPFSMSICDNIAFGAKLFERLSRSRMDNRVEWTLTKAVLRNEVRGRLNQSGYGLPGGQQQCLCIARGIAIRPEVLLLDKPCSALDSISTGRIEELIAESKDDCTIVIVTHNIQQTACCSDYAAHMCLGELVEFGDTGRIFIKSQRKGTEDYITGCFG